MPASTEVSSSGSPEPGAATSASGADPLAVRLHVVLSKLSAPPLRAGLVDRPLVVDRLLAAADVPVVLLSAPPGYGKTTALSLWRRADDRSFAWLSLEPADDDPVQLLRGVACALDPVVDVGEELAAELVGSGHRLTDRVLPGLVNAWARADRPLVLVLDDLHVLRDPACLEIVVSLTQHLPSGSQLALATRTDPALALAGLRMHGRLLEVRAADLAYSAAEAAGALAAAGADLTGDQVRRLVSRTEGWPAAVYLAALSIRDRPDPGAYVEQFTGTNRHVADVLNEDVLQRQPEHVVSFLLRTSILDDLTPALCDAVTGGDRAAEILHDLERSNLFVVPLDEDRLAYRYHHLFAEYLRAELDRREPGITTALHQRAWHWYADHRLTARAVEHARASGDVKVATDLVVSRFGAMYERGETDIAHKFISELDDTVVEGYPPLTVAAAWLAAMTGDTARALHLVEVASAGSWDGPMPDGAASLESAVALAIATFASHGISQAQEAAERALALEPMRSQFRPLALTLRGAALMVRGEDDQAQDDLAAAARLAPGRTATCAYALASLGLLQLRRGDLEGALEYAGKARRIVDEPGLSGYTPSVLTHALLASVLTRRGQPVAAALAAERAETILAQASGGFWWLLAIARLLLAPALAAHGHRERANHQLAEVRRVVDAHPDCGVLAVWHAEAQDQLACIATTTRPGAPLSVAEERVWRLLGTDLTLREIGRELHLSVNTVKTHTLTIYRKLNVCSRAEAVRAPGSPTRAGRVDRAG